MRHDWIFDVLNDLKTYCLANGLLALAAKTDEAILVAQEELARLDKPPLVPGTLPEVKSE